MAGFGEITTSAPDPSLLPVEYVPDVIKMTAQQSALLSMSARRMLATRVTRIPVLSSLPQSYWVGTTTNDFSNMKQTTHAEWKGINLNVEELAVLVPVPNAYMADENFPVWSEIAPFIAESMGAKLDAAGIFGVDKPASWPDSILASATAAGNTVAEGTGVDFAQDVANLAAKMKRTGYAVNGFASEPGLGWELTGLRSTDGLPIYQPDLQGRGEGQGLYGFPLREVLDGAWDDDKAKLLAGDWTKSIVGIRQDITFERFDQGIISDTSGKVILNAMQQDCTVFRAVFRVAWAVAAPATRLAPNPDGTGSKYPFGLITPKSAVVPVAAPTNQALGSATATALTLTWDYAAGAGEAATGFEMAIRTPPNTGTWSTVATEGASATSHTFSGLTAGTQYEAQVRSIGAATQSAYVTATGTTSAAAAAKA